MRKNVLGLLLVIIIEMALVSCTTPSAALFDEEFDSLDTQVWSATPSLTPFPGFEGSNTLGEVKVESGMLKLSRYAPELAGENPASFIQTRGVVDLPSIYTATMRFKNEFAGLGLGKLHVAVFKSKVWVGYDGIDSPLEDSFEYQSNSDGYFILSLHVTDGGYTVTIKEDAFNSTEETFSRSLDLSKLAGDSIVTVTGGSNIASIPYSEIDYIRISP
ncbi:MAG: hypothetical protein JNM55_02515 [Anaerolineales bacterium]|nr:hypothetical protein [Anaerolineales bacterium]